MRYCEKCGKQLLDEAFFCDNCGYPTANGKNLQRSNTKAESRDLKKNKAYILLTEKIRNINYRKLIITISVIASLIFVFVFAYTLISPYLPCAAADCDKIREDNCAFCASHKCKVPECMNYKEQSAGFCDSHTCMHSGCNSLRETGYIFCSFHKNITSTA